MTSINLLPNSLRIKNPVVKLTAKIKKIAVIELMLLVFIGVVTAGSILILSRKINEIKDNSDRLESNIKTLQSTEQRLVLIKDRATNIGQVLSLENAYDEYVELQDILDSMPAGSSYSQVYVSSAQLIIEVNVASARVATELFREINQADFSSVVISNFSTSINGGYNFNIVLNR
jgi:hypothetical protein